MAATSTSRIATAKAGSSSCRRLPRSSASSILTCFWVADPKLTLAKILRGTKAGDIPMEQPTTYELAINAATARKLGIRIPEAIRVRIDRVIDH
ncbi:MAG TPA: ABC transporter substrate binding protein [Burkholderiales bacterium]|nr:ABC transporter substrate binding protein [Burkholderiales bacterium]